MTEGNINDEQLLEQFFQQARQQEIADDGFTERVVKLMPNKELRLSRLWTAACIAVGLLLFTLVGGWRLLGLLLVKALITMPTTGQIASLWLTMLLLSALLIAEVFRRECILEFRTFL